MSTFRKSFLAGIIFMLSANSIFSQEKLKTEGPFPIVAWVGVPEEETTIERFRELKESGININFSWYANIEAAEKALDIAHKAGVKLLFSCPELKSDPEKTVKRVMKHPGLSGYHLRDEPTATDFAELGTWVKRIQSVDRQHYCYINLLPNYASAEQLFGKDYEPVPGKDVYAEHLDVFIKEVPVPFISLDHYPVTEKNGIRTLRPEWYKNLEIAAAACQKNGLPLWAFALSVAHTPYPVPTIPEIKLQMYSNLAYGAQALQYFTYWTPAVNSSWDFHQAPIDLNGKRTHVYDYIKSVNQEIQNVSGAFLGAKLVSVAHTGSQIPVGTRRLDKLPSPVKVLETGDSGAIVSILEKGNDQFMVIVNRDFKNSMKLTMAADPSVKKVLKDGTIVAASAYANTTEVDPGDAIIFTWPKSK